MANLSPMEHYSVDRGPPASETEFPGPTTDSVNLVSKDAHV